MKKAYILLYLAILILTASPARASFIDLGVAGQYNTFIFNDYTSSYTDTEGALAVGGNATMTGYGVGVSLSADYSGSSLVVGGDLDYTNGQVYHGDVSVGGSTGSSLFTILDGSLNGSLPFDFDEVETYLKALSLSLSGTASNGLVSDDWGVVTLTGDSTSSFQVFNISGEALLNANTLLIDRIAEDATILINVSGTLSGLTNMGMLDLAEYSDSILFNFYEAEDLILSGVGVEGSILAPLADVDAGSGNVNGTLIASSYDGNMEQHLNAFRSTTTPVPEPGTFVIMGFGLLGLAVFVRRRRRRAKA